MSTTIVDLNIVGTYQVTDASGHRVRDFSIHKAAGDLCFSHSEHTYFPNDVSLIFQNVTDEGNLFAVYSNSGFSSLGIPPCSNPVPTK